MHTKARLTIDDIGVVAYRGEELKIEIV